MKWIFRLMLPALVLVSCSKEGGSPVEFGPYSTGEREEVLSHGMIQLGAKLSNPYSLDNVSKALASVYPTRSASDLQPTDLYVRFLPKTEDEYSALLDRGIEMLDHPLDYAISVDGDYYHDPSLPEEDITWQYAVVPSDFRFPEGITHEVIERCFIPDEDTRAGGLEDVDWDAVERRSFELSGNGSLLSVPTRSKARPSGRIAIMDERLGRASGVAEVKIVANVFVKVSTTYTDADGNYSFSKKFSARPRYRLCFQNKEGFSIGLNLVLVPASVSALGKDDPEGINVTIDRNSDNSLFRRCAVNNAACDYIRSCRASGLTLPPSNLRIWIMDVMGASSTLMLHHGALMDSKLLEKYLGIYRVLVRIFAPDIVIGAKGKSKNYSEYYSSTVHELSHASHFSKVGTSFWNKFAAGTISSYLMTGSCYGSGSGENAGFCAVGEMLAFYSENIFCKDRYGTYNGHGDGLWFHPEILRKLEEGGVPRKVIIDAFAPSVKDVNALKVQLESDCPSKKGLIEETFGRYF